MAVQLINVGNIANDGTGDDLREAMIKINQNFEELDLRDDEQTTASNLGLFGEGVFANKVNYDLQFKRISAGDNITVTADDNKIIISNPDLGLTDITVVSDFGQLVLEDSDTLEIIGGPGISTTIVDNRLTINNEYVSEIVEDTTPQLGGNLDAQGFNLLNVGSISAASVSGSFTGNLVGNVTGLINGVDPSEFNYYTENFDFGNIAADVTNILEWLAYTADVNFGTINNPDPRNVDFGTI